MLAEVITKQQQSDLPSRYSEELNKIVKVMMNKDPKDRPTAENLLSHPNICATLSKINLKTRSFLIKEKSNLKKKENELALQEERLRRASRKVERMRQEYEVKLKQLEERKASLSRQTRNIMPEYNTTITRTYKNRDHRDLNRTADNFQDMSAMYSSEDKKIETSIKYVNRYSGNAQVYDNKENMNSSNLMSSNSSLNRQTFTSISGNDSKNLSGSNRFEDSQHDLSRSKTGIQKHYKEHPRKKININLYSDGNSSASQGDKSFKGNVCLNSTEKIGGAFHSLMTGPTNCTVDNRGANALRKHLDTMSKERSIDNGRPQVNSSTSTGLGLPPSGQSVHKSITIEKGFRDKFIKNSQEYPLSALKRNFSSNQIGRIASNEENSRNRLGNRKSIPANFRGEEIEGFHQPDSTAPIMSSRHHNEDFGEDSQAESMYDNRPLHLKKADSDNTRKPPVKDITKMFKLKNFNQNAGMARTMSRGKLMVEPDNRQSQNLQGISTKNQPILNNKTLIDNIFSKNKITRDTITPKNHMMGNLVQDRDTSRRASINNTVDAQMNMMHYNNGSVTNRTHINPLQEESIPDKRYLFRNPSGLSLKKGPDGQGMVLSSQQNLKGMLS